MHYHEDDGLLPDEKPACVGQWCCGCAVHPIGKPWGWNVERWSKHYAEAHREESA